MYVGMAIVQKKMDVQRSIYEMLQLVSVSLTDTVELKTGWFYRTYFVLIVKLYNNQSGFFPDTNDNYL